MARPYKINAEYFSHDADMRNDVKVKALRRRFGLTGYAVWCFLLEALTDADSFEIEWTPTSRELYAADFDIAPEELDPILSYSESIGLIQRRGDIIFSEAHQRRLQAVSDRRMARATAGRLGGLRSGEARRAIIEAKTKQNEAILQANAEIAKQNEAKESKGKENKENENREDRLSASRVVDLWNSICGNAGLPRVEKLTDSRRKKIKIRLAEFGDSEKEQTETLKDILNAIAASSFLRGENKSRWTATFDWLVTNSENWAKVLEGNYSDTRGQRPVRTGQPAPALGVGEFVDGTGRRTYGTGRITIPRDAPPRPSDKYCWSAESNNWVML